ncbi:hypothetical protein [Lancefieldella rimae]|uniref:hypothetical protein n=1 Tax=Lancefieldella rimae TaxID=1383 RepID=UPI0028E7B36B|nr:hypothetical protein [Lancefieldella rimae]
MFLEHLKGFDKIGRGVDKLWIYKDPLHRELAHDYLQKVNFSLQDINDLLRDSSRIEKRIDVIVLIVMVDWIANSVWQYKSCLAEGLMDDFRFSHQSDLEHCRVFLRALRSIAVAHPLNTYKHDDLGLDGDIICVDLRISRPAFFASRNSVRRFGINGIEPYVTERSDDVYLYVYSKNANARYFEFLIVDLLDLVYVACVYIDQLCEIDKHLSKLRKKDYAAK